MKHPVLMIVFFLAAALSSADARKNAVVVFEASVLRVEPWAPIRVSCGVVANYRLAEYSVNSVHQGRLQEGNRVVVQHLACSNNELDDLNVGDRIIVVAES